MSERRSIIVISQARALANVQTRSYHATQADSVLRHPAYPEQSPLRITDQTTGTGLLDRPPRRPRTGPDGR